MKTLIASLLLSVVAAAQCPVEFKSVNSWTYPNKLEVVYFNRAEKKIKAVKLGALFFDATGDPTKSYLNFLVDGHAGYNWQSLKPNKKEVAVFDNIYGSEAGGGARVWPIKISFEDGSTWEPARVQDCAFEGRKK